MSCDKVKRDFCKRYASDCENIFFMGKPITFFKGSGGILGCGVSAGSYLALEKRQDDRVMIQFSSTDKFLTFNMESVGVENNNFSRFFLRLKNMGAKVGGVRLFFYQNSSLSIPDVSLLLMSLDCFCSNLPSRQELMNEFGNYTFQTLAQTGKANYLSYIKGGQTEYLLFRQSGYKIIICKIRDGKGIKVELQRSRIDRAREALRREDYNEFGSLLTAETADVIKAGKLSAVSNLYNVITKREESVGCGIVDDGALFAVVENKYVDFFIENVSREYARYFGASPKFYITDTETAGRVY